MKQQKISRDGIHIYRPREQKKPAISKHAEICLLTAVQLLAVWFLALSWWTNLTSVFPIQADAFHLYCVLFVYTAVLTSVWNMPLQIPKKLGIFAILCAAAGCWIWRHPDAAVTVINSAANAYLSICRPEIGSYPVTAVSETHMAVTAGLFLAPLLFIWSLSLHIHRGRLISMLLLLAPAALSLITNHVPSELSCWLVILSGGFFCSVYRCRNGRAAFINGIAAACILALIIGFSALVSRPLEQYKQPLDGFYAETRVFIQTKWIAPIQNYVKDAQEKRRANNDTADNKKAEKNSGMNTGKTNTDETDAEIMDTEIPDADSMNADSTNSPDDAPDSQSDDKINIPSDITVDVPEHAVKNPLFSADDNIRNSGNTEGADSHANGFPDLNSLSHYQPDYGVRMTISLDTKPDGTFYHPVAYGGIYADGHWNDIQAEDAASYEYLQYPDTLPRLEELCLMHAPKTAAEASDFIQHEFEENTVYDYEPGAVPSGKDFAEYFLFENQKGFCVHFATTAALMYRICGIPSRYVHGYAIPASAFHRQEDGTYLAEVTGDMGHAWCEVYSDSEWILKEHTLPYYGIRPETGTPAAASGKRTWKPNAAGWLLLALQFFIRILLCLFIAAVLLFVQAVLRRQRKYQRFQRRQSGAGIQSIYRAIYDSAVFHGMQKADFLNQKGFELLRKYCPEMDADSMEWLYEAVLESMFYRREITKDDLRRARKLYQQFSHIIIQDLRPYQKFIYLYVRIL